MFPIQWPITANVVIKLTVLLLFTCFFLAALPWVAHAQADNVSPPAPLQWPVVETRRNTERFFNIGSLRSEMERGVNGILCKQLMKDAGKQIPANFTIDLCPAEFITKINARQGRVRWALGAKPSECGTHCIGRPFMDISTSLNKPNVNFAKLFGKIELDIDAAGLFGRKVIFNYEANFNCVSGAAHEGDFTVELVFDKPVVDGPDFLESFVNFLVPVFHLSDEIEKGILRSVGVGNTRKTLGRCNSIGVNKLGPSSDDSILYNEPPRVRPTSSPIADPAPKKIATVRFLNITRKTTFGVNAPAEAGGFRVFLNGVQAFMPDLPSGSLPSTGGSASINLCKTISMEDSDRLQIIFLNTLGGTVWSQFSSRARFGTATPHTITTGRTITMPGTPGPPDPVTGKSSPGKPFPLMVREFELLYTIEYHDGPVHSLSAGEQPIKRCRKI